MQKQHAIVAGLLAAIILASGAPAMAQSAPAQNQAPGGQRPGASPAMKMDRQALRKACAADTQTLCAGVEAGGGKIMQCLRSHRAQLSTGCQSAWGQLQTDRKAMRSNPT